MTERLFHQDAYLKSFEATVTEVDGNTVILDQTGFYATSGGQPHDTGELVFGRGGAEVTNVVGKGAEVVHHLVGNIPDVGQSVRGTINWPRRYDLMRTHTAMHILCGVVWREWSTAVTGGNMDVLSGRMDFELGQTPEGFKETVTEMMNAEVAKDRPIEVSFLPRGEAVTDEALIRTKVNLIPESVAQIRVIDIVGLDKQADGGTHVARTSEVGRVEVTKVESKGKGFKRVRVKIHDPRQSEPFGVRHQRVHQIYDA